MFIVYKSSLTEELIICSPKAEEKMIKDYFTDCGRDIEWWERTEISGEEVIYIESQIKYSYSK